MSKAVRGRWAAVRWRRMCALGLACALAGSLLLALPEWLRVCSRPVRRGMAEEFLSGLRIAYLLLIALALPFAIALAWASYRSRRQGRRRPFVSKLALVCGACLLGMVLLEALAAAWLAWAHRLPVLRDPPGVPTLQPVTPLSRTQKGPLPEPVLPSALPSAPEEAIRIVVVGGSSAQGTPYYPWVSIGQIVAWQLEQCLPSRRVQVEILAEGGANLERMHHRLEQLTYRPDLLIVYSGHNEFQSRYPWSRRLAPAQAPSELGDSLFRAVARYSPLCRMIGEAIETNRLDAPPRLAPRQVIDWPMCSPAEYAAILADFRRRLEAITQSCERWGTLAILMIPAANDCGFEPSRTALPASVSSAERAALVGEFEAARTAEAAAPARAIEAYRALVERQPAFAEAHFRLARLLERAGDYAEARDHYLRARDADALPIRCPTPFQNAYRAVAAAHHCILIDSPAVLQRASPHGIVNSALFHDAHHPTLRAHTLLAEAVLRALRARGAFGPWSCGTTRLSAAECAKHFGMDAMRWWVVCERTSEFYRNLAVTRYDPFERLAISDQYGQAARAVAAGRAPETLGVPGLGVGPAPAPQ